MNKDEKRIVYSALFKSLRQSSDRIKLRELETGDLVIAKFGTNDSHLVGFYLRTGLVPNSIVLRPFGESYEVEIVNAVCHCLDVLDRYDKLEGSQRQFYEVLLIAMDHPLFRARARLVDVFFDAKGWTTVRVERMLDGKTETFKTLTSPVPSPDDLVQQLAALRL